MIILHGFYITMRAMKTKIYLLLLPLIIAGTASCEKSPDPGTDTRKNIEAIDGHLSFKTTGVFDNYISQLRGTASDTKSGEYTEGVEMDIPGFTSIAKRRDGILTKAGNIDRGGTQMTKEEWDIYNSEILIDDPVLEHVLDTNMFIEVGDYIYKITKHGTFKTLRSNDVNEFLDIIDKFDVGVAESMPNGSETRIGKDVTFINTFYGKTNGTELFDKPWEGEGEPSETKAWYGWGYPVSMHSQYNVNTMNYPIGNKINGFAMSLGFSLIHSYQIDANHSVVINFYNTNVGFYASQGVSIRMQEKRKRILFEVWTNGKADRMALGFNGLHAKHSFMLGGDMYFVNLQDMRNMNIYDANMGSAGNQQMIYKRTYESGVPYLSGLGTQITFAMPKLKYDGALITKDSYDRLQSMNLCTADEMATALVSVGGYNGPALMYIPSPSSRSKYSSDTILTYGVKEVYSSYETSVNFLEYGGFEGFKPMYFSWTSFHKVDVFGSVNYKGRWYGVRINIQ